MSKDYYIVFSYGLFKDTHKIFSYEKDGKYYLPIYTDGEIANAFQAAVSTSYGKDISIQANISAGKKQLKEMLETVAGLHQELLYVSINPNIVSGETKGNVNLVDEEYIITEYIEKLQEEIICNPDPE